MKVLKQLATILGIYFVAHVTQKFFNLPLPATIIGMILLFLLLLTGIIKLEMVEGVGQFFLDHLTFLFIPGGVGLIVSLDLISNFWLAILLIVVISVVIILSVTGLSVQILNKKFNKSSKQEVQK